MEYSRTYYLRIILLPIPILFLILAIAFGAGMLSRHAAGKLEAAAAGTPIKALNSSDLPAWENNYLQARNELHGKNLRITGSCLSLRPDPRNPFDLLLPWPKPPLPAMTLLIATGPDTPPLACRLNSSRLTPAELAAAAGHQPGRSITVKGIYRGRQQGRPTLNPCRLPETPIAIQK